MKTRQLGHNGPSVSAIGLGCMGMTDFYTTGGDRQEAIATLHRAGTRAELLRYRRHVRPAQ